jgi:hypothetical protein
MREGAKADIDNVFPEGEGISRLDNCSLNNESKRTFNDSSLFVEEIESISSFLL